MVLFNFIMNASGQQTLTSPLSITNNLNLNLGVINTNGLALTLGENATITGGSGLSFVAGQLLRTGTINLFFPIGKDGIYTPVTLSEVTGTGPVIGVEVFNQDVQGTLGTDLSAISSTRYWSITNPSGTFTDALITLPSIGETFSSDLQGVVVGGSGSDLIIGGKSGVR